MKTLEDEVHKFLDKNTYKKTYLIPDEGVSQKTID